MMDRVGAFGKVKYEQFFQDMCSSIYEGEEVTSEVRHRIRDSYDLIEIPERATSGSAGYDIMSPIRIDLEPGAQVKIPTGINSFISPGWFLMILPRSSMGFKYQMQLANTCAVIDGDYLYSENSGHIFIKIVNRGDKPITIQAGDRFAQGIFVPFGITYTDNTQDARDGGIGSTGK